MLSKTQLKKIVALKNKKIRSQQNLFLTEGFRLCHEAIQSDFVVETLLINPTALAAHNADQLTRLARKKHIEIIEIDDLDVKQLSETVHSQGAFCIIRRKQFTLDSIMNKENRFFVIIDAGQDPGNVGTIIRTCDWFGVDAVILTTGTVELYNPKVIRSTMGSIFHVPVIEEIDLRTLVARLKEAEFHIYMADVRGESLYHQTEYHYPLALILGNENRGPDKMILSDVDKTIKIPSHGKAESLNLALSGAIIISRIVD